MSGCECKPAQSAGAMAQNSERRAQPVKRMKHRLLIRLFPAFLLLPLNLFGKCPISANGTLELLAPAGNLVVDTTGTDSVEVEVSNRQVVLKETCGRDVVTVTATMPSGVTGLPDWKIRVPKGVSLDLSTQGGSIQVADTDGRETKLRTSGGRVTAGAIKGNALILANEVRTGEIGGNAEVRGQGGKLQVGNVGGDVLFFSTGGDIATGIVKGRVKADTGSGSVTIRESSGDVIVTTQAGDITSEYVHGAFDGKTDSGNIRIDRVGSWVHAVTGVGDIFFRLVPVNFASDLHIKAEAGIGDITMYLPEKISATINAIVDKPALKANAKRIFFDFPSKASTSGINAFKGLIPGGGTETPRSSFIGGPEQQQTIINSGANNVRAHTSAGTIRIYKGN